MCVCVLNYVMTVRQSWLYTLCAYEDVCLYVCQCMQGHSFTILGAAQ